LCNYHTMKRKIKKRKINFDAQTLLTLGRNARFHCCNCGIFAHDGEGAHIISPSDEGPRSYKQYDEYKKMNKKYIRKNINIEKNGLWLCRTCHKEIDKKINLKHYSVEKLRNLKKSHEDKCAEDYLKITEINDTFTKKFDKLLDSFDKYKIENSEVNRNSIKYYLTLFHECDSYIDKLQWLLKSEKILEEIMCNRNDYSLFDDYVLFIKNVCYEIRASFFYHTIEDNYEGYDINENNETVESLIYRNIDIMIQLIGEFVGNYDANNDVVLTLLKLSSFIMGISNKYMKDDMCCLWGHLIRKYKITINNIDKYLEYFMIAGYLFKKWDDLYVHECLYENDLELGKIVFGRYMSKLNRNKYVDAQECIELFEKNNKTYDKKSVNCIDFYTDHNLYTATVQFQIICNKIDHCKYLQKLFEI
jgi:hypothetical protein